MNMNSDPLLENLLSQLGDFGPYQLRQTALLSLSSFLAGIHMFGFSFVTTIPKHRCYIPGIDSDLYNSNYTLRDYDASVLDSFIEKDANGNFESCSRTENGTRFGCDGQFVFEEKYHSSIVVDLGLVCEDKWKHTFLHFAFLCGILNGAVVLSMLSDRFGRKLIFYISGLGQLLAAFSSAVITNYYAYIIFLFIYGAFGCAGAFITGLTMIMELVGPSKRAYCGTLYCLAFTVGGMLAGFWAFLIHNLQLLQMIYSFHSILLIGHWWLIDESPRWLWAKGRQTEAVSIVKNGVESNGKHLINNYQSGSPEESSGPACNSNPYFTDLLLTPNLRGRTLNVAYNWVANSLLFSSLSFTFPGTEPLFISFLNGLLEFPGYLIVIGLVDRTGRRSLSSLLLFLSGFATALLPLVPNGGFGIMTGIAMLAKSLIAGNLAIMVTYSAELFPTVVRGSGLGVCGVGAGAVGMLISQITTLNSGGIGFGWSYVIFGLAGIFAAIFALFLPETLKKELPSSLEDGENFGRGDNAFKTLSRAINRHRFKEDGTRFQLQNDF